ncbi:MAG: formylglycine-generating enzyme family protein [Elusimicrobia bacterium]|nr:formylglycine-generating enzyme family protein [Elusimicrobiota bacterium]
MRKVWVGIVGLLCFAVGQSSSERFGQQVLDDIEWVEIPGGYFTMGSENGSSDTDISYAKPAHGVTIKPFKMSKTEVTLKQYAGCVAADQCTPIDTGNCYYWSEKFAEFENQPVVCVTWQQAQDFAAFAGGRLPSESEWEYAARGAGKNVRYPWGWEEPTCERANFYGCGNATKEVCKAPEGNVKLESGGELCDMAGNVWEWVQDTWHRSYKGAPEDGSAWEDLVFDRVARGGSWLIRDASYLRSALRLYYDPGAGNYVLGFRLARSSN